MHALSQSEPGSISGAIHTSELDRSEIDLSPKLSECERSNANWDRPKIDLNECEHFLKANWDRSQIDQLRSILVWTAPPWNRYLLDRSLQDVYIQFCLFRCMTISPKVVVKNNEERMWRNITRMNCLFCFVFFSKRRTIVILKDQIQVTWFPAFTTNHVLVN